MSDSFDESPEEIFEIKKLDKEEAAFFLSDGGPLSAISDNYEERSVQIELLKNIVQAFNKNSIGVFEAGTGVGKSYAYLIPAILWAFQNKERIIISTGTINLQQQLCEKDIPMAQKITGKKIKFLLMKGRQNYVCLRRFEEVTAQRELFNEDIEIFDRINDWLKESKEGSKSELPFLVSESVWSRINSESDACMGQRCPFFNECFVMRVRKLAAGANLIVVNHHLLFADIESRLSSGNYDDASVLPPYKHIIFDEAHGIENAATSFFSEYFNRFKVLKQINQLYRQRKNSQVGYLCTLAILSSNEEKINSVYEAITKIKTDINNLEMASCDLLADEYTLRICQKTSRAAGSVISLCSTLAKSLEFFVALGRSILEGIADDDKEIPAYWEARVLLNRIEENSMLLKDFSYWDEKKDEDVFWIQKKLVLSELKKEGENDFFVIFTRTPLDISKLMNIGVYEPMKSIVFTSATLKTGNNFNFWMRRCGLHFADQERLLSCEYASPFPYEKNMLFAVPSDSPLPDESYFQNWIESAISKLIVSSNGRTLVLFTSYDSLKKAYNACLSKVGSDGVDFNLLCQGQYDNARLLENFRDDVSSCLFATDSFWQGVDVPGESLSQVIIAKLPFSVPNDPIFTARAEAIEKKGGSSFMELSIPEAVIKFRQGIGRLMRRSSDKGSVVVLDRRLYEKRYGAIFLSALPNCKKIYDSFKKICEKIEDFNN